MMLRKLHRAHHTLCGHFAPAYLVGSNKLRAYIFFIYDVYTVSNAQNKYTSIVYINSKIFSTVDFSLLLISMVNNVIQK